MATPYYGVSGVPEYYRDVYGSGEVSWIPPVVNYSYNENVAYRGANDREFRWEEVQIPLEHTQSGALLNFIMPDLYMVQITPDIGWHDELSMFGENDDDHLHNPHLKNIGPLSIDNGILTDNGDNSVTLDVNQVIGDPRTSNVSGHYFEDTSFISKYVSDTYKRHLWRAVPYANGNPALGGLPQSFEWVAQEEQVEFVVDPIVKETKAMIQTITGTKGARVTVSYESADNLDIIVDNQSNNWTITFPINRTRVSFVIVASDQGGSAVIKKSVNLTYDHYKQAPGHIWNNFDSFGLLASVERLPNEGNMSIKARTIDAFANKGASHYRGLIVGCNRELGLSMINDAITLSMNLSMDTIAYEPAIEVNFLHDRVDISGDSFRAEEELHYIDRYRSSITVNHRIKQIISIMTESGSTIPVSEYQVLIREGYTEGREIVFTTERPLIGRYKATYIYYSSVLYVDSPTIGELVTAINNVTNPNGDIILNAVMASKLSGNEYSSYIGKSNIHLSRAFNTESVAVPWSLLNLSAISNHDWKWSFADKQNMFFSSSFYEYVGELKSKTNVEWGFVVADEDYWDAVDQDWYGYDSLPFVFDSPIANYSTDLKLKADSRKSVNSKLEGTYKFDPLEAFRMGYVFDGLEIVNRGYSAKAFRSGVGYKKDCVTSVHEVTIRGTEDKVNLNPVVYRSGSSIEIPSELVDSLIFEI